MPTRVAPRSGSGWPIESAGGILGLIVAARQVGRNMGDTLKNLRRMVET
jgi:hypothetical protein